MFPFRFLATVYRVLSEESDFFPVDDPEEDPDWDELDTVAPNTFFAFAIAIPWRVLDAITRVEKSEGTLDFMRQTAIEFVSPTITPESLFAFLVVPCGLFYALVFRNLMTRISYRGSDVTFREAWHAIAYVFGSGFTVFCGLAFLGVPFAVLLSTIGVPDILTILGGAFCGVALAMSTMKALARATDEDELYVYGALLAMILFPYLLVLIPPKRD